MTLIKATDQLRIIKAKDRLDGLIDGLLVSLNFNSIHRKRLLIFLDIIEILIALMVSIHIVCCIWLYCSDNVH